MSVHASSCQVESSPMTATLSSSVEGILLRLGVKGRHRLVGSRVVIDW